MTAHALPPNDTPSKKPTASAAPAAVDEYSALSQEILAYCVPFIYRGYTQPIEEHMVPDIPARMRLASAGPALADAWAESQQKAKKDQAIGRCTQPSLALAFSSTRRGTIAKGVLVAFVNGIVNAFVRPYILRSCLIWLADPVGNGAMRGVLLWLSLFVASLVEGWSSVATLRICTDEIFAAYSAAVSSLICSKAFSVSKAETSQSASALIGNDVMRAYESAKALGFLPLGLASIISGVVMLMITIGWACVGGLVTMLFMLILTRAIASRLTGAMRDNLETSSARVEMLEQIVDSSKAVKFFSWEESYLDLLRSKRQSEVAAAARYRWLMVCSVQLGRASPILSAAVTICCMVLLGQELVAADIFATISVFMALRLALIVLPQGYTATKVILLSVHRIQQFLLLKDEEPRNRLPESSSLAVHLQSASLQWPTQTENGDTKTVLSNLNLDLTKGELVAVVGAVGSGKSTLLSLVVGELLPTSGQAQASAKLYYAPQQPQVICGTVRDNILLGRPLDAERLQSAVEDAQLTHDLEILDGGLDAEIGERGVSLSGGQKQRISLARTIYGMESDCLLVLDDPVAAVDPKVGQKLMHSIVKAHHARGGTVLVSLNQREHLHLFEKILEIDGGALHEKPVPADSHDSAPKDIDSVLAVAAIPGRKTQIEGTDTAAKVLEEEHHIKGPMGMEVVLSFVRAMGLRSMVLFCFFLVSGYALMVLADLWLVQWTQLGDGLSQEENYQNLGIYVALVLGFAGCVLISSKIAVDGCTLACTSLHEKTMRTLLKAPLSWWDGTPKGRITSRFSTDIGIVDTQLGFMFDNYLQLLTNLLALCIVVMFVTPIIIPAMVVCFGLLAFLFQAVDKTNREVKRMAHQAISPVLSNIAECQQMRRISRILLCQGFFEARNVTHVDFWNRMNFNTNMLMHFCKLMAASLAALVSAATAAWLMFGPATNPETAAIAMTYSIIIPYFLGMATQVLVIVKAMFTCLERVLEYCALPQEPDWHLASDPKDAVDGWPAKGNVEFKNVSMRYRKQLPLALHSVSFSLPAGSRTGVIGRTGSGKSTLVACLFRLHEVEGGSVFIDGVDLKGLGLRAARRHITVVPQDPVLMQGTVRTNLDPFGRFSDDVLLRGLRCASLAQDDDGAASVLKKDLSAGGSNVSCGERQLLCLARAVIQDPKVLVMDEPTSSADADTDQALQRMLRTEFHCTTLCIAHRIQTIADSDLVLVMRDGRVLELGPPSELYAKAAGEFRSMCDVTNVSIPSPESAGSGPESKIVPFGDAERSL